MTDKQDINAGNDSTNIQGRKVIVYNQGLEYDQVRQIALDVFKANFYELSETAKATAIERAEELVNNLLSKLQDEAAETIDKFQYPDVQYAVINAQKQFARSGKKESLNLLTDLLKDRFLMEEGSLKAIVLNEAIETLPKITINQIKTMCAIFLVKQTKLENARTLIENLNLFMPAGDLSSERISFYEHLLFSGVAAHDNLVSSEQNLEYFIRQFYGEELNSKVDGKKLDVIDPPVRNQFIVDDISGSAFEKWNNSFAKRYALTSVGIAIALAFYNGEKNVNIDLGKWI